MRVNETLAALTAGEHLTQQHAKVVFDAIMAGALTPAQIAAVLAALKTKGETVDEIAGAALAMRAVYAKVETQAPQLVDTCGTGGSGTAKRFNISTAAAFVAAAAGAQVAKHGNRGMSSKSGSADVLEAAGVNLELPPAQVGRCIDEIGVGFLFAPNHHPAMRHAGPVRRELGIGTIFNLLGPLTNPTGAKRQLLGVFAAEWQQPLALACRLLGSEHVLVVHSNGLDELSIDGPSSIVELSHDTVDGYEVAPGDFGLRERDIGELRAETPAQSLALVRAALNGSNEDAADIVALNAGAAIYAAGICPSLTHGVTLAQDVIATGQASEKFAEFADFTRMAGAL